jgi:pimeloyl-ACP methyl ester carboxylesterase
METIAPRTTEISSDEREIAPAPPGCAHGYVRANGLRFHCVAGGAGPLVLLLHGFPECWYSWRAQLPALAARSRVVAPDLRGYNLTERPALGYDIGALCEDVRALIEALGEREATIVGHDWGGVIAWCFAIRYPDYARRLAIVNAPHPAAYLRALRRPVQLARSAYVGFFQLRGRAERVIAADDYAAVRRLFRAADPRAAWLSDADIGRYVAALARPGALSAALEYYRQLRPRHLQATSPMRVIRAPTLVLWGERDSVLGPELLDGLDLWVRDLSVRRFPAAGHWLNQEEPERVNAALLDFLA